MIKSFSIKQIASNLDFDDASADASFRTRCCFVSGGNFFSVMLITSRPNKQLTSDGRAISNCLREIERGRERERDSTLPRLNDALTPLAIAKRVARLHSIRFRFWFWL